jgi:hypothetical protein
METAKIYPIDTDQLNKGDKITPEEIASIFHAIPGTADYALQSLRLRDYITQRFMERSEVVTIIAEKNALRILTDAEAAEYNRDAFKKRSRQMLHIHLRACGVDTANLDDKQQREHERVLLRQGVVLSHMRYGWKAPLIANERKTPKIAADE